MNHNRYNSSTISKFCSFSKHSTFLCAFIICLCLIYADTSFASPANNKKYNSILKSMEDDLKYALDYYEIDEPGFKTYSRKAYKPLREIPAARYSLDKDGIYRSDSVVSDGVASITLTGDLMCQSGQQEAALKKYDRYEFDDNYVYVKDVLSDSDFTIGNLETMLSERASFYSEQKKVDGQPQCNAPSTYLDAVRGAGYDMVVTANNHNCDTGVRGIFQTMAHLDQYELIHTGTFTNASQKRYQIVEIDGIKVAFMSYARGYNSKSGHLTDKGVNVMLNYYNKAKVKKDISAAKKDGAEYIIVYIHWGVQFMNEQNETQEEIAQELADVGVDYIIGSHPHALQPYDHVTANDGRVVPVIYSMGNFVSHMLDRTVCAETIILKIELERNRSGKVVLKSEGYIPGRTIKKYKGNNYTTLPLTSPYNGGNKSTHGKESFGNITSVISDRLDVLGRCPMSYLNVTQDYTKTTYDGYPKNPKITVKTSTGKRLKDNVDYYVTRENNINVGYSTITVTGKNGYIGKWTGSFLIRPIGTTIKSITSTRKSLTLKYEIAVEGVDGYQIEYCSSKDFSHSKKVTITDTSITRKKITDLKPDCKYYVRIRTYQKVDGEKIYSKWSDTESISTKE